MRSALAVPRGFSTPRMLHCRPRIAQPRLFVGKSMRGNASSNHPSAGRKGITSSSVHSSDGHSFFWTPGRTLLASAFAAGLGYAYASYGQTTAPSKKTQYGSMKDFDQVWRWSREHAGHKSLTMTGHRRTKSETGRRRDYHR